MNKRIDIRDRLMPLLKRGLLTQIEAARIAGTSRQRVHQWVKQDGIKPMEARKKYLQQLMREA